MSGDTVPKTVFADGVALRRIGQELPGAELWFHPYWLDAGEATSLQVRLAGEVPWQVHRLRLFGREVDAPRLSCWMGDAQARYRYSGTTFVPQPWNPALAALRHRLAMELGLSFNSVLLNRYRDGRDAMGWHSDDEPELGPRPVIASVSLGGTRRFTIKSRRREVDARLALELPHGSLLVMAGDTQQCYRHALPRTAREVSERLNLTFRCILPRD